tara:strand:- start:56 stop:796 length:741 start_codon:yes stop_codon:yes gene_type:complete
MFFKNISTKFLKFIKLFANNTTRRGLYYNIAASIELEDLIKDLELNIVIDIGSNKGQFVLILNKYFENLKILSFEPINELLEKQKKFFKNTKNNIKFFNTGVGALNSKIDLNITRGKDSSSILEIENINNLGRNFDIIEKREINVITLENALNKIDLNGSILLKLDVQGYELKVLEGAEKLLPKIKYIITEVAENKIYKNQVTKNIILKYLKEKNFEILKSTNVYRLKNTSYKQKDVLLVNKSLIK